MALRVHEIFTKSGTPTGWTNGESGSSTAAVTAVNPYEFPRHGGRFALDVDLQGSLAYWYVGVDPVIPATTGNKWAMRALVYFENWDGAGYPEPLIVWDNPDGGSWRFYFDSGASGEMKVTGTGGTISTGEVLTFPRLAVIELEMHHQATGPFIVRFNGRELGRLAADTRDAGLSVNEIRFGDFGGDASVLQVRLVEVALADDVSELPKMNGKTGRSNRVSARRRWPSGYGLYRFAPKVRAS